MKAVFFGTPQFSAEILKDLIEKGLNVVAVVTQPDKMQGRHLQLTEPAVKKTVQHFDSSIPVIQTEKISTEQFYSSIKQFEADIFIVVAFGQIFPTKLLQMPRLGCVNVHTSLLPKYRGAAPIERCLMAAEVETGVSIMYMVKELDAGDVLSVKKVEITPEMNALDLTLKLCQAAKDLLYPTILKIAQGKACPKPQKHELATYAKKVNPEDAEVKWNLSAIEVYHQYRGVSPKPGAWCSIVIRGKPSRIKLKEISLSALQGSYSAILSYDQGGIVVACKEGAIKIKKLQIEGKKVLDVSEFVKGYSLKDISFKSEISSAET